VSEHKYLSLCNVSVDIHLSLHIVCGYTYRSLCIVSMGVEYTQFSPFIVCVDIYLSLCIVSVDIYLSLCIVRVDMHFCLCVDIYVSLCIVCVGIDISLCVM